MTYLKHLLNEIELVLILTSVLSFVTGLMIVSANLVTLVL